MSDHDLTIIVVVHIWHPLLFSLSNTQLLEKWFNKMGTPSQGIIKDLNLYQEQLSKLEASEQVRLWHPARVRGNFSRCYFRY